MIPDGPATFEREQPSPPQAWMGAVLDALKDPARPLPAVAHKPLAQAALAQFEHTLLAHAAGLDHVLAMGHVPVERQRAVLATGKLWLGQLQRADANWLTGWKAAKGLLNTWADEGVRASATTYLALEALNLLPTARPTQAGHATSHDARAEAGWAYALLDTWFRLARSGDSWGTGTSLPQLASWTQAVDRLEQRLTAEGIGAEHWRAQLQVVAFTVLAGHPHEPTVRVLTDRLGVGFPRSLGGPGLAPLTQAPLHMQLITTQPIPAWLGATEALMIQVREQCAARRPPARRPTWAPFLSEGLATRQGLPATQFADATGQLHWTAFEAAVRRHHRAPGALPEERQALADQLGLRGTWGTTFKQAWADHVEATCVAPWRAAYRQWELELAATPVRTARPRHRS